jgi:hypothetical protein
MQTDENNAPARHSRNIGTTWILIGGAVIGLAGAGYGVYSQREGARIAASQQAGFNTTVSEMQQRMQALQDRLAAQDQERIQRERASAPAAVQQPAAASSRKRSPAQGARRPVDDPRIKQLEQKLSDQNDKLADTQRTIESTRSDLESRINSSSQELNGSIARTSEEVAALRRRGERDYFEFDIAKSKSLQRVGPVSVGLRKSDPKHKRYNLDMMVDDNKLEKKSVNLFEPVYITSPEWTQPLELVVNRVDKDRVKGYISTPKYKRDSTAPSTARSNLAAPAAPVTQ